MQKEIVKLISSTLGEKLFWTVLFCLLDLYPSFTQELKKGDVSYNNPTEQLNFGVFGGVILEVEAVCLAEVSQRPISTLISQRPQMEKNNSEKSFPMMASISRAPEFVWRLQVPPKGCQNNVRLAKIIERIQKAR